MKVAEHHVGVTRRARFYTLGSPQDADDIWFVLHGYGQLASKFIQSFRSIAADGRLIVAPEGLHRFYLDQPPTPAAERRVGATWMTREDRESDILDYVDFIDQLISETMAQAPGAYLRVLGFSQGSATMLRWAVRATKVPHQLMIWAGEVPGDVDWMAGARKLAHTRIHAIRGDRDDLTPQSSFEHNLATLSGVGLAYHLHSFTGRHHMDGDVLKKLAADRS